MSTASGYQSVGWPVFGFVLTEPSHFRGAPDLTSPRASFIVLLEVHTGYTTEPVLAVKAKFTEKLIKTLSPKTKRYDVYDEVFPGFLLRVETGGTKTYYLKYRSATRAQHMLKLGRTTDISLAEAREEATRKRGEIALGNDPAQERQRKRQGITLGRFLDDVYAAWLCENTRWGAAVIKHIRRVYAHLLDVKLADIGPQDIERIRTRYAKAGKKGASNRYTEMIMACMGRAYKWGYVETDRLAGRVGRYREHSLRVRYLDAEERARLLSVLDERDHEIRAARAKANNWRRERGYELLPDLSGVAHADHVRPLVLLAMETGARRGELFSLRWEDVNLQDSTLTIHAAASKSGRTRHIPLSRRARELLDGWRRDTGNGTSGLVFPSPVTGERLDNITSAWEKLLQRAQLEDFRFHDLRHDFASRLVMHGVDLYTVKELLGHSTIQMTERYSHLAPEAKQAAIAVLDEMGNAP